MTPTCKLIKDLSVIYRLKILKSEFRALKTKLEKGKFAKEETKRLYDEYCRRRQQLRTLKRVLAEISDDSGDGQSLEPTDSSGGVRNEVVGLTREPAFTGHSERVDVITIDDSDEEEENVGNLIIKDVVSLNHPVGFFPKDFDRPGSHQ